MTQQLNAIRAEFLLFVNDGVKCAISLRMAPWGDTPLLPWVYLRGAQKQGPKTVAIMLTDRVTVMVSFTHHLFGHLLKLSTFKPALENTENYCLVSIATVHPPKITLQILVCFVIVAAL